MRPSLILIVTGLAFSAPAFAQDWGSDYNMGSIGVLGGSEANGTIMVDCAEAGNPVVPKGSLTIFLKPAHRADIGAESPGDLTFSVDGTDVVLPVSDNKGDGFVFDKTPKTLANATTLIDLLKSGQELLVTAGDTDIARIPLDGAAAALDGVEACLV